MSQAFGDQKEEYRSYDEKLRERLWGCYRSGTMCDVVFRVTGEDGKAQNFPAHAVILASLSTELRAELEQDRAFNHTRPHEIHKASNVDVFRSFLEFAYTDDARITQQNAFALVKLADDYGVVSLEDACVEFIDRCLQDDTQDKLELLVEAIKYEDQRVDEICAKFLESPSKLQHKILEFEHLEELDYKLLLKLVASSDMKLAEEDVWRLCIRWFADDHTRIDQLKELVQNVRFRFMSVDFIKNEVRPLRLIDPEQLTDILLMCSGSKVSEEEIRKNPTLRRTPRNKPVVPAQQEEVDEFDLNQPVDPPVQPPPAKLPSPQPQPEPQIEDVMRPAGKEYSLWEEPEVVAPVVQPDEEPVVPLERGEEDMSPGLNETLSPHEYLDDKFGALKLFKELDKAENDLNLAHNLGNIEEDVAERKAAENSSLHEIEHSALVENDGAQNRSELEEARIEEMNEPNEISRRRSQDAIESVECDSCGRMWRTNQIAECVDERHQAGERPFYCKQCSKRRFLEHRCPQHHIPYKHSDTDEDQQSDDIVFSFGSNAGKSPFDLLERESEPPAANDGAKVTCDQCKMGFNPQDPDAPTICPHEDHFRAGASIPQWCKLCFKHFGIRAKGGVDASSDWLCSNHMAVPNGLQDRRNVSNGGFPSNVQGML